MVTGQVTGIAGFGGANLFVIIQRVVDNPLVVSIVVDVKSITPIRALSTLLKKDLNDIPLIKDFTADLAIEYSTGDILSLNDQKLNEIMAKYISKAKTISKGNMYFISLYFYISKKRHCIFIIYTPSLYIMYMKNND